MCYVAISRVNEGCGIEVAEMMANKIGYCCCVLHWQEG